MTEIARKVESESVNDSVLIVCSSSDTRSNLKEALGEQSFEISDVGSISEASAFARKNIVDLVLAAAPLDDLPLPDRVDSLSRDPNLGRAAMIHLIASSESEEGVYVHRSQKDLTAFLPLSSEPADLLVKLSTLLRLRKLNAEQRQSESDIEASNLRLRDLTARFQRELDEAKSVQKAILPTSLPKTDSCAFAAAYLPIDTVGGDMYDVWELTDSRFAVVIADVTGHGLPAAFVGAMTKIALGYAPDDKPARMLENVNAGLEKIMPEGRFVTATAAILDTETGQLTVSCAGHPPPIVVHADNSVEVPALRGLPLGISPTAHYEELEIQLEPGCSVLFVTDGLTETQNLGGDMFGMEGVAEAFRSSSKEKLADRLRDVLESQKSFSQGRLIKDDITLVGLTISS